MPRRNDIQSILLIGSGPIVIGQACEFDYSGTQACKALKQEGYRVILVNSNPATIMTDPELVDATYLEPITTEVLTRIIEQERPDVILPTMGGQTALNMAMNLDAQGVLAKYGVELIGANVKSINMAENREEFRQAMNRIGIKMARSKIVHTMQEALDASEEIGLPIIIRPSFTLGGAGGGIAETEEQLKMIVAQGLAESPTKEVLVEQSIVGWKEYEMEVMRDTKDNVVIICSIENFDPMGVHTGDSITVAPAQTLTDAEYQDMRDCSLKVIREIGVDTGGSNIQFAINPENGEMIIIEMNPRVSRSSALASKATGFPIAKIAAKLAVGYTLDEIPNDITRKTPASFEPSIDYVVTKIPRFTFEKFPLAEDTLSTQMKSVGEVMAMGRTFKESLQKALRSLELGSSGFDQVKIPSEDPATIDAILANKLTKPFSERVWYVGEALRRGWSIERIFEKTKIDPWFLHQIQTIISEEPKISVMNVKEVTESQMRRWKRLGYADERLAVLMNTTQEAVTKHRKKLNVIPAYKIVDTCAAEFSSYTPYFYSTYEEENESIPTDKKKVVILGSGPNRIGQGIEFDYCCVHAAMALKEIGYEAIMVNCNPETVSTDYDTSDRLYFEPITFEDVMHIVELEQPIGVIVQLGGQTPLKLARQLQKAGVRLLGTSFENIDRAEDRYLFSQLINKLNLKQPANGIAHSLEEAYQIAEAIEFPVLVRPSYVLGGRAMEIVYDPTQLAEFFTVAAKVSPEHPVLIDKFLINAVEVDMDLLADGHNAEVAGIMEHIEPAGVHSGDSACSLPPHILDQEIIQRLIEEGKALAKELNVIGLMNIQFAVREGEIFVIEVNPRASRTVPFVSKSIGHPIAKYATRLMVGERLEDLNFKYQAPKTISVKETVFPFAKFAGSDTILGPEMKSTGEVMGWGTTFEEAFLKSQMAVYHYLPSSGMVYMSVRPEDLTPVLPVARELIVLGFQLIATEETYNALKEAGIANIRLTHTDPKLPDGVIDYFYRKELTLVINTATPEKKYIEHNHLRRLKLLFNIPYYTTLEGASMFVRSLSAMKHGQRFTYTPLTEKK